MDPSVIRYARFVAVVTALTSAVSAAPVCAQDAPPPDPPFAALAGRLRTGDSVRNHPKPPDR